MLEKTLNKIVVVIPTHKEKLNEFELISFKQALLVFKNYDIYIVGPNNINFSEYKVVGNNFQIITFDPIFFSSLHFYNKLKINSDFYVKFEKYDYLLTYELDSFVFKDDLEYWSNLGVDYIGAPWFKGFEDTSNSDFFTVGNSGFSMRKISTCIKVINRFNYFIFPYSSSSNLFTKFFYYILYKLQSFFLLFGFNFSKKVKFSINEDLFFSVFVPRQFENFYIPDSNLAMKFSFEFNPRLLFEKNNFKLPTGCHAWAKYDIEFWRQFINI